LLRAPRGCSSFRLTWATSQRNRRPPRCALECSTHMPVLCKHGTQRDRSLPEDGAFVQKREPQPPTVEGRRSLREALRCTPLFARCCSRVSTCSDAAPCMTSPPPPWQRPIEATGHPARPASSQGAAASSGAPRQEPLPATTPGFRCYFLVHEI